MKIIQANCGKLNETLGSSKVFKCSQCHYSADRDIQAARNILLSFLTLRAISFKKLELGLQPKTEIEQSRQLYHINGGESWKNDYSGAELEVMFILITNDNFI